MAGWLILFVMVIYFIVAISLFLKGNFGLSLAFFGYALSNIGLYSIT